MLKRTLSVAFLTATLTTPATAGPVVCTTTLEALDSSGSGVPVEVTTCEGTETTDELMRRRAYTWTPGFNHGVDMVHQITDLFGIALAGPEGNRLMGFGFTDQTIVWDGSAIENTFGALQEEQSPPMPIRTADISSGFNTSLAMERSVEQEEDVFVEETFPSATPLW